MQDLGGDADGSPRLVLDALALPVLGRDFDEVGLEAFNVELLTVVCGFQALLEVVTLLDQKCPAQRIGSDELRLDLVVADLQRVAADLAAAPRPVLLECDEVPADDIALAPSGGESVFVLVGESCLFLCWLLFAGRHPLSLVNIDEKCKPRAA